MPKVAQHHALARQWEVLRQLPNRPPGITARELLCRLESAGFSTSKRTIERDLAELATLFGIICNDKGSPYGWYWMKGVSAELPGLSLTDAVSLQIVESLLRPLLPPALLEALEGRFQEARRKLKELAPDNPTARWADKVRYVQPSLPLHPPSIPPGVLETVQEALLQERQLSVSYQRPGKPEATEQTLHPQALIQRGPITYLVAMAFDYDDLRLYAVHRIKTATIAHLAARTATGFSLDAYLAEGRAHFANGNEITLRAHVSDELANLLSETPISIDQVLHPEGKTTLLTATVIDSWQLRWWLLSQGAGIAVIDPPALRASIKEIITEAGKQYI